MKSLINGIAFSVKICAYEPEQSEVRKQPGPPVEIALPRYQPLLDTADVLAPPGRFGRTVPSTGARRLAGAVSFEVINFALHRQQSEVMHLNIWKQRTPLLW